MLDVLRELTVAESGSGLPPSSAADAGDCSALGKASAGVLAPFIAGRLRECVAKQLSPRLGTFGHRRCIERSPRNLCSVGSLVKKYRKIFPRHTMKYIMFGNAVVWKWRRLLDRCVDRVPLNDGLKTSRDALGYRSYRVRAASADEVLERIALRMLGVGVAHALPPLQRLHNVHVVPAAGLVLFPSPLDLGERMRAFPFFAVSVGNQ